MACSFLSLKSFTRFRIHGIIVYYDGLYHSVSIFFTCTNMIGALCKKRPVRDEQTRTKVPSVCIWYHSALSAA